MGLKYRDPITGEYVKYNFPLIKGEKGEQGPQGVKGDKGPKGDKGDKGDMPEGAIYPEPNSIPQRNKDGNIYTAEALGFKGNDFEIPLVMDNQAHLHSGVNQVWDSGNLPIESGTFLPNWIGASANVVSQLGEYVKIGNLVYVLLSLESTEWYNHGHDVVIGHLPYLATQETPISVDMVKGLVEPNGVPSYHTFGLVSGNVVKLYKRGIHGSWWGTLKTQTDLCPHTIIKLSFVYRTA